MTEQLFAAPEPEREAAGGFAHERTADSCDWWTPIEFFIDLAMGFDLDPCAPPLPAAPWLPAKRRISLPQDGLAEPWEGRVWLNPPYGQTIGRWTSKLAAHGDGVALTFSRTDTRWWQQAAGLATTVCFISSRIKFVNGRTGLQGDPAGAPACLLAYGQDCAERVERAEMGLCVVPELGQAANQLSLAAGVGTLDA